MSNGPWPTREDLTRLRRFVDLLTAATVETGVAIGICPGCEETKLYDLKPGHTVVYRLEAVDHLFVDIPDGPCEMPPEVESELDEERYIRARERRSGGA